MSGTIDEADDKTPEDEAPGGPPPPSVTPGSAPPPPPGTARPTWSRRGCLLAATSAAALAVVALVVVVVVLVLGGTWLGSKVDDLARERQQIVDETGIRTSSTDVDHPPQRDIRLGACEADGNGGIRASGTITNWTDNPGDYRVALRFRDGGAGTQGAELGSTVITVDAVESHLTTNWAASIPVPPSGDFTCRIVTIDRWVTGTEAPGTGGS